VHTWWINLRLLEDWSLANAIASRGRFKCNIDALFSLQRNQTDIGMGLRDDECEFVLAKTM